MNNLCDEQLIHDNNYTNTYSLWGNSKYYDIKNLSPQNYCSSRNATETVQDIKASFLAPGSSVSKRPERPEPPDCRSRRTIKRESLYEDPEAFYKQELEEDANRSSQDWTQMYWHKASERADERAGLGSSIKAKKKVIGPNKIQKKLDKMLAVPVKMSKAESMMQKMGWQGGALGKTGDGIVEPIAPNAVYAKAKIGFGQNHIQIVRPPKFKKGDLKHNFDMNVLLNINEFVRNNAELELLFDRKLKNDERKRIHQIVQYKLNSDNLADMEFESGAQVELILQIGDKNCYILETKSYGSAPYRQLCLYKEAPAHVYLITPDDLRDEKEEEETRKAKQVDMKVEEPIVDKQVIQEIVVEEPKNLIVQAPKFEEIELNEPNVEEIVMVQSKVEEVKEDPKMKGPEVEEMAEEIEIEEETNPFLRSITRNLKKPRMNSECQECEEMPPASEMLGVREMSEITVNPENTAISEPAAVLEIETAPEIVRAPIIKNAPEITDPKIISDPEVIIISENPSIPDTTTIPANPKIPPLDLPEMSIILTRIVDYFIEFTKDKQYSHFKFLGPFSDEEIDAINEFLEQAMTFLSKEECPLAPVFEKLPFEINVDCAGNTVINKKPVE